MGGWTPRTSDHIVDGALSPDERPDPRHQLTLTIRLQQGKTKWTQYAYARAGNLVAKSSGLAVIDL